MKRALFALAIGAATISLFAGQASADRLTLSEAQCVNPSIAPKDRVAACTRYLNDGLVGADLHNTQYALGYAYRLAGDYTDAEASMTQLVINYPKWPNPLLERSTAYAEDGKYDLAMADIAMLRKDDVNPAVADMQSCWVRGVAGKELDAGAADCDAALKLFPGSFAVLIARALIDYKRGDMSATIADCSAALDDNSRSAAALYLRGIAKGAAGADDIDKAKRLAPYIGDEFAGYGVKPSAG
ncbi:MAG TPA: hypothetical protein VHU87_11955 [Rhizomicrobium sp.]|jgi:tetratricopeptide (TPR) repeat protein|nr:hypothetical protein [Rhizomicrobium sp.]